MGKYDLLVTSIEIDQNPLVHLGSGVILSLGVENEALLVTAKHVIMAEDGTLKDNLKLIREIDGQKREFPFQIINYVVDKENDLAIVKLNITDETVTVRFLKPVESKSAELVGYPGVLKNSPSITKYPLPCCIRSVLSQKYIIEIQHILETFSSDRKDNLDGFSGGGIFHNSAQNDLYFLGIETGVLTKDVVYNACEGISASYIYAFIVAHSQELDLALSDIETSIKIKNYTQIHLLESDLHGSCYCLLSEQKLNMSVEKICLEYKDGVSAHPDHIRYRCNVHREYWTAMLHQLFQERTCVIIRGASGQGKSTLAYDYLMSNYQEDKIICINGDISLEKAEELIRLFKHLEDINEYIIYMDVQPNSSSWYSLCQQWNRLNFKAKLLISIREEDYNRVSFDRSLYSIPELQLQLTKEEASSLFLIYKNAHFVSFEESWSLFGEEGPLMEYVYLLNHSETMRERLRHQILNIENSDIEDSWIDILAIIALAGQYGGAIEISGLLRKIRAKTGRQIIARFEREFFVKISSNGHFLHPIHALRSKMIFEILLEDLYVDYQEVLLKVLTVLNFDFQYAIVDYLNLNELDDEFLQQLINLPYGGIKSYTSVLKSLLWYEVANYKNLNQHVIDEGNKEFRNTYSSIARADISGLIGDTSVGENLFIHFNATKPGIHDKYKELYNKFSPSSLTYSKVDLFLNETSKTICNYFSNKSYEFSDFGFCLFWMGIRDIFIDESTFRTKILHITSSDEIEACLNLLAGLWIQKWYNVFAVVKSQITSRLYEKLCVLTVRKQGTEIFIQSFIGMDEALGKENPPSLNDKCMEIVYAFKRFEPEFEKYNVKLVGIDDFDMAIPDTEKHIESKNLYYAWIVQLNATFRRMNEYDVAPDDWRQVMDSILDMRKKIVQFAKFFLNYMESLYRKGSFTPSKEYLELYNEITKMISGKLFTKPKTALDKNGISEENVLVHHNTENNAFTKPAKKEDGIEKVTREYFTGIFNFVDKHKELIRDCENGKERTQSSRVAYYGLVKAHHLLPDFQRLFDEFFSTYEYSFDNNDELNTLERLATLARHMYLNKYYTDKSIGYNTMEELKQLRKKIDRFVFSIQALSSVQSTEFVDGIIKVTLNMNDFESFLDSVLRLIHNLSEDMNIISLDGYCLSEKIKGFSISVTLEGHYIFKNIQYATSTFLCNGTADTLTPSYNLMDFPIKEAVLNSKEDAFINLNLQANYLEQILSIADSISTSISYPDGDGIIDSAIVRLDKWLCESVLQVYERTMCIIEYLSDLLGDKRLDLAEEEKEILRYLGSFSHNPMIKTGNGIFLNSDTLDNFYEAINRYCIVAEEILA